MNRMVTIKLKPIIDIQKIKRKKSKHNTTENHQKKMEETKETINKIITIYISIITLHVNGLNVSNIALPCSHMTLPEFFSSGKEDKVLKNIVSCENVF